MTPRISRNDPCPCASGKKYKKCCMPRMNAQSVKARPLTPTPFSPVRLPQRPVRPTAELLSVEFTVGDPDTHDDEEPPDPSTVPVLPVEVGLDYTYPEPLGEAHVTYIFPAGRTFILSNGTPIQNEDIKPGMRIYLKDGALATVTGVRLSHEPPDPPVTLDNALRLSRVVGTIKHKGFATVDVSWPGYRATSSPDHPYYSVSRGSYVHAQELRIGEFLRTDDNLVTAVQAVTKPTFGLVDLYNVEVEHFHNYFVGEPGGSSVLVHNGVEGSYINTPAETEGVTRLRQIPRENGYWSNSAEEGAPADGIPGESYWHSTDSEINSHPDYQPVKFTNRYPEFEPFARVRVEAELTGKPGSGDHKAAAKALGQVLIDNPELADQLGIPQEAYARGKNLDKPNATGILNWMKQQPDGGLTWHHHEDMESMLMVPTAIHDIPHAGGADLLRQATGIQLNPERWR